MTWQFKEKFLFWNATERTILNCIKKSLICQLLYDWKTIENFKASYTNTLPLWKNISACSMEQICLTYSATAIGSRDQQMTGKHYFLCLFFEYAFLMRQSQFWFGYQLSQVSVRTYRSIQINLCTTSVPSCSLRCQRERSSSRTDGNISWANKEYVSFLSFR